MFEKLSDKLIGLFAYYVLIFDPLRLRKTAGKAIALALHAVRVGVASARVAIARAIAVPMGRFMQNYVWFLGITAAFWFYLRFKSLSFKDFTTEKALWTTWSQGFTIPVVILATVWAIVRIRRSAAEQILHGEENITHWVNAAGAHVEEDEPGAIPVHHGDDKPLRVSFFRSGALLTVATWLMGIAMFFDALAAENQWLLLPVIVLLCGGVVVVKVVVVIGSWVYRNSARVIEVSGEIAAQPLAALPELKLETLKEQLFSGGRLNIFDEEGDSQKVDESVAFVLQIFLPFLILSFLVGADQLYSLIIGGAIALTVLMGIAYSADGHADSVTAVQERRRKFLRAVFMLTPWLAIPLIGGVKLLDRWGLSEVKDGALGQKTNSVSWLSQVLHGEAPIVGHHSWWANILCLIVGLCILFGMLEVVKDWKQARWKALGMIPVILFCLYFFTALMINMGVVGEEHRGLTMSPAEAKTLEERIAITAPKPAENGSNWWKLTWHTDKDAECLVEIMEVKLPKKEWSFFSSEDEPRLPYKPGQVLQALASGTCKEKIFAKEGDEKVEKEIDRYCYEVTLADIAPGMTVSYRIRATADGKTTVSPSYTIGDSAPPAADKQPAPAQAGGSQPAPTAEPRSTRRVRPPHRLASNDNSELERKKVELRKRYGVE